MVISHKVLFSVSSFIRIKMLWKETKKVNGKKEVIFIWNEKKGIMTNIKNGDNDEHDELFGQA